MKIRNKNVERKEESMPNGDQVHGGINIPKQAMKILQAGQESNTTHN